MNVESPLFIFGTLLVALLYSSVGHGGASGYLALMAFSTIARKDASTMALAMNLAVAGISFLAFHRAKFFDAKFVWPFLLGSVPMAFMGGKVQLPTHIHAYVIGVALIVAAFWLFVGAKADAPSGQEPQWYVKTLIGAFIGFVSGLVGVGGGVFLSPIIILFRWADAKKTASTTGLFILVNSAAGLVARPPASIAVVTRHWPMLAVGIIGALIGASVGAFYVPGPALRRTLAVVLLLGVIKLFQS